MSLSPVNIDISYREYFVSEILEMIKDGDIEFSTRDWWGVLKQSDMVESAIVRIPMKQVVMYYEDVSSDAMIVGDGNQRLKSLYNFINNSFALEDMKYIGELEGKKYDDLPRNIQRRILETRIPTYTIRRGTPSDVLKDILHRLAENELRE